MFFREILQLDKIEGADFKYDNIIFNFSSKMPKSGFFGPKFKDFIFSPNFATPQIWGLWFQIWQYFQISAPNYGNLVFLAPNLRISIFCTKLCNKANLRVLISNMTMIFQNCDPKHPNKALLVSSLRILIFARNFTIRLFGGHWLEIWQ